MTVQKLIEELQGVEDKSLPVKISHYERTIDKWTKIDVDMVMVVENPEGKHYVHIS